MYNEGCEPVVRNCKFTGNYASIGGGMGNCGGARPVVEGCIFEDNEGARGGETRSNSQRPLKCNKNIRTPGDAVICTVFGCRILRLSGAWHCFAQDDP